MFSTWDSYRNGAVWGQDDPKENRRHHENPLSRFLVTVDLLLYAAALGFTICVIALVVG